jgi:hypothetical protein
VVPEGVYLGKIGLEEALAQGPKLKGINAPAAVDHKGVEVRPWRCPHPTVWVQLAWQHVRSAAEGEGQPFPPEPDGLADMASVRRALDVAESWACGLMGGKATDSRTAGSGPAPTTPAAPLIPAEYCTSWREILAALGKSNDKAGVERGKVIKANRLFDGPIKTRGQGCQPWVNKAKLLEWWNSLERLAEEAQEDAQQQERNAHATLADQHNYGRDGTVAPGISGGVKKSQKKPRP